MRELHPRTQMHISKQWFSSWCLSCSGHFIYEHFPEECCPIKAEMMEDRDNWLAMTTLTMQGHISISQLLETAKHGRQSAILGILQGRWKGKPKLICLFYVQLSCDARAGLECHSLSFSLSYSAFWLFLSVDSYSRTEFKYKVLYWQAYPELRNYNLASFSAIWHLRKKHWDIPFVS